MAWRTDYDEWGNLLREDNPENQQQLTRLSGLQSDNETGMH
ncbi:hypothetical protein ACMWIM_001237 [Citrobacter amalonaticus]|nr:hypothetical protein [Citrobacter amalonaticus]MDL4619752.1 hypothetical protein [Citrobacter amalonaticus]MDL4623850.1 hypothetical protein [Citrobacter amalonaticus]